MPTIKRDIFTSAQCYLLLVEAKHVEEGEGGSLGSHIREAVGQVVGLVVRPKSISMYQSSLHPFVLTRFQTICSSVLCLQRTFVGIHYLWTERGKMGLLWTSRNTDELRPSLKSDGNSSGFENNRAHASIGKFIAGSIWPHSDELPLNSSRNG